jgi:pre-mRNA-splicing factor CDC5/CEF1
MCGAADGLVRRHQTSAATVGGPFRLYCCTFIFTFCIDSYTVATMPLYVKGGAWTNVEDEILKAAVSKYGLNQWARVSSLLTKKSAKQAKARWNEWLSPTINKSTWTREEDDKLLLLAKIMPNQWQSIAPVMGRTAASCSDRYNELIEGSVAVAQAGDVNLNAELQPARPDEADDEEMELLAEAKARLANTQGKKAQRKARERMLRETLRVSQLQKRHELKQAGVSVKLRYSAAELNHIPHERAPSAGIYDTSEERATNESRLTEFDKKVARAGVENAGKKRKNKDDDTEKAQQKQDLEVAAEAVNTLETEQLKRRKLNLPMPGQETNAEAVDDRISSSVAAIKSRMSETSALASAKDGNQVLSQPKSGSETRKDAKKERKMLRNYIAESLSRLPPPRHHSDLVLPKLADDQESITIPTLAVDPDAGERRRMLETLRLVDEEKAKLRRSQAIQKGLSVPHPNLLLGNKLEGLDKLIADELRRLVSSDYKKYEDPRFSAALVEDLAEDVFERIHSQIDNEVHSVDNEVFSELHPRVPSVAELPPFSKRMVEAHKDLTSENAALKLLLDAQYTSDIESDKKIARSILDAAARYAQQCIDVKCYENILEEEKVAIEARSARLHEMVDSVIHSEHAIADRLKST